MVKHNQKIFAILDLGSSRTVCFIAKLSPEYRIEVIGIGSSDSNGIRAGIVTDIRAAEDTIMSAVRAAEEMADYTIDQVVISISGSKVKSHRLTIEEKVKGREISQRDIDRFINAVYERFDPDMYEVVHCIPINYNLDGETGIKDPKGMYGTTLSIDMHVITTTTTSLLNIANCLARCHLNISECVVAPYASGLACLTKDEQELGSTLIDIGGGHTSIAVFKGGHLIHTETIALGGIHITSDIAWGVSSNMAHAERIKVMYGHAMSSEWDDQEKIDIPPIGSDEDESRLVTKQDLGSILRPRVEEIVNQIKGRLESENVDQMSGGRVVLAGGGSQLAGMQEFMSYALDKHVRVSNPMMIRGLADSTKGPGYATAIGMLEFIAAKSDKMMYGINGGGRASNYAGKVAGWFKNNF
ncbi:MAG: cell division protein FtsA [Rickettsiales bacterium]|nr:cell division protein FtsA [Rickettsiales bacterium]